MVSPKEYELPHEEWRPFQEETINWALEVNGVGLGEMPVGSGKTGIARAVASRKSTTALVRTKNLQATVYNSYGFDILYGRANYPCIHEYAESGDMADSCPYEDQDDCPYKKECPYLVQKKIVRNSNKVSINYSLFLSSKWCRSDPSEVLVCDEGHLISDIVLGWVGCRIKESECRQFFIGSVPEIQSATGLSLFQRHDPTKSAIGWLSGALNSLERQLASLKRHPNNADAKKRIARGINLRRSLTATLEAIKSNPTEWYITSGKQALEGRRGKEAGFFAKPLTSRYHFPKLFLHSPTTICMSGTIGDFDTFAEELGVKEYVSRQVPSQFPPEVRPVYALDVPHLNYRSGDLEYDKQADAIATAILDCPRDWSGIIHVTKKKNAPLLAERLAHRGLQDRVWVTPDLPTDQQMVAWNERKAECNGKYGGQLCISWSMTEGVDLTEERICIAAKCFTPDVELFGPNGAINIGTASVGDKVYSLTPSGELVIGTVEKVIVSDWDGDIYDLNAYHCDLTVTDNHDMLVDFQRQNDSWGKFFKVEMRDVADAHFRVPTCALSWNGVPLPDRIDIRRFMPDTAFVYYRPPGFGKGIGNGLPSCFSYHTNTMMFRSKLNNLPDDWLPDPSGTCLLSEREQANKLPWDYDTNSMLRLIGWFVSEGHTFHNGHYAYSRTNFAGDSWGIGLSQNHGPVLDRMTAELDKMHIPYNVVIDRSKRDCRRIAIHSVALYRAMLEWCGKGAKNKHLPDFALDSTRDRLSVLFETMMEGDGHYASTGCAVYTTSSHELKDDVISLGLRLGWRPRSRERARGEVYLTYDITMSDKTKRKGYIVPYRNVTKRHYTGKVWCVQTDIGTVLAGRNGIYVFTGNCRYADTSDPYEAARQKYSPSFYNQRAAWDTQQALGRTRRGEDEDYDTDGQQNQLVAIADGSWTRLKRYFSADFAESIIPLGAKEKVA